MILGTQQDYDSTEFKENFAAYSRPAEEFTGALAQAVSPQEDRYIQKHRQRGKLLARERVQALIDLSSDFVEISPLAGLGLYEGVRPGAGIICGVGKISGKTCVVVANDATVKGGTYFPMTVKKHLRAQEIAMENGLPCLYLADSGGAFLPMQDEVFPDKEHFGRIFYNQAKMSGLGIPQIAVVMGSCTAGGAYVPAMCDEAIIVKNQGTVFLGGPPLVKAATGETISAEELGGGEVHCSKSGVTDYLAGDDAEALRIARQVVANLNRPTELAPQGPPPRFSSHDIPGLIPADPRKYFPIREILARLLDGSELDEFKANFGTTIICGFAHVQGQLVGVLANDGILFSESALKAAHFIQLCGRRRIPLLFVQNIVGFMVGREYEHRGIAKDGAKMVTAVACAPVPKVTLIVGGSFGAGNYAMAGRAYQPNFLFSWPNSRISVMGPEQAANVLAEVKLESAKSAKTTIDQAELAKFKRDTEESYQRQAKATYATARLWDDGIIHPHETRSILGAAFAACRNGAIKEEQYGIFRM
jgi:3-methylcrotonyl-CoA carboxylase beta subunit